MSHSIALFGAAEKGDISTLYVFHNTEQLYWLLGEPPPDSEGLYHAVQILEKGFTLFYHKVEEEGVDHDDYSIGFQLLSGLTDDLNALFLPKVGSQKIINQGIDICEKYHSLLIMKESDLYDFLTNR